MNAGQSGGCSDQYKVSLLSFSITSLVQLIKMGSLAGFLYNSKSLLGIAAGLGLARLFSSWVGLS